MNQHKCFKRPYTTDQLDRGEGMHFHPCRGNAFHSNKPRAFDADLRAFYDAERHEFYSPSIGCTGFASYLPRISEGADKKKGDPYPAHWLFDPFTGALLLQQFDRDYSVEELDSGDSMRFHPCYFDDPTYLEHATYMSVGYRIRIGQGGGADGFYVIDGYEYCPAIRQFVLLENRSVVRVCPRISQNRDARKGDAFPDHWDFCPFTGSCLK